MRGRVEVCSQDHPISLFSQEINMVKTVCSYNAVNHRYDQLPYIQQNQISRTNPTPPPPALVLFRTHAFLPYYFYPTVQPNVYFQGLLKERCSKPHNLPHRHYILRIAYISTSIGCIQNNLSTY